VTPRTGTGQGRLLSSRGLQRARCVCVCMCGNGSRVICGEMVEACAVGADARRAGDWMKRMQLKKRWRNDGKAQDASFRCLRPAGENPRAREGSVVYMIVPRSWGEQRTPKKEHIFVFAVELSILASFGNGPKSCFFSKIHPFHSYETGRSHNATQKPPRRLGLGTPPAHPLCRKSQISNARSEAGADTAIAAPGGGWITT
jgi:hypothetical protein